MLFISLCILAQQEEITYLYFDNYNDSLKSFQFQNKFITSKLRSKDGKLLQETERRGDNEAKYQEINYEYDTKSRLISKEWNTVGFVSRENAVNFKIKYEWTYNEVDSIVTYSFNRYSFSQNKYNKEFENRHEYNNQNLLIAVTYSGARNTALNDYEQIDYAKNVYYYGSKKQLIREEYFDLYYSKKSVREYTYNQSEKRTQMIFSSYNSGTNTLTEINRKNFEYDSQGNLIAALSSYIDLTLSPTLIPLTKETYKYDNFKREISTSTFQYQRQRNSFQEIDKTTSTYNEEGLLSKKRKAYLSFVISEYAKDSVIETRTYEYYSNRKLKAETQISSSKDYTAGSRSRYEYQTSENASEIGFNDNYIVYPNPATDKITVTNTLTDDCLESVALHDMSGKQLLLLERTETPICVWKIELPPMLQSGVYLLYCKSFNGKITGKKFVIQK